MVSASQDRLITPERRGNISLSRPQGRSPPQWVGRRGRTKRQRSEVIVEQIVERAASTGNFPVMMKLNYYNWVDLMHVMLQARGLWHTVKEGSEDYAEDHMALEVIAKVVPPEMLGSIMSKPTMKVVWESITLHNVGVDRVWKAKASSLKRVFDNDKSVDSRSMMASWWTTSARTSGES
jgi:hypothetical protein